MHYSCQVTIDLPRERVVALFDDPDNMKAWQPGLIRFEPLTGTPGQPGATSRLLYQMGRRRIEMIETVVTRDLPETFTGTYDAKGVHNVVANRFVDQGTQTLWMCENEFRFSGFMKVIGVLMPGAFRRQTQQIMDRFKAFAEASG